MRPVVLILGAATLFAFVLFGGASAWMAHMGVALGAHGYVAMGLGIFASVGVGVGLMAALFYSSRTGHDDAIGVAEDSRMSEERK